MCGRFALHATDLELADLFGSPEMAGFRVERRYNVAPGQWILIMRPEGGRAAPASARWGLEPAWARPGGPRPINARAETLDGKPMFRQALLQGRCLVPASAFYEWQARGRDRQPFLIRMRDGAPFAMAGLEAVRTVDGEPQRTCAIVTTEPNALMADLHDRMPAILPREAFAAWLDPALRDPAALKALLRPFPAEAMEAFEVGPEVGDARREGPSLAEPRTAPPRLLED